MVDGSAQRSARTARCESTSLPGQGLVLFAGGSDYYCTGMPCSVTCHGIAIRSLHGLLFYTVTYPLLSLMYVAIAAPQRV
jgi:hypothetical protein